MDRFSRFALAVYELLLASDTRVDWDPEAARAAAAAIRARPTQWEEIEGDGFLRTQVVSWFRAVLAVPGPRAEACAPLAQFLCDCLEPATGEAGLGEP
jgi:hypothetical protein